MDDGVAKLIDASQLPDVLRHIEKVERLASAEAIQRWGISAYGACFILGSLLLIAWALWPRHRVLTLGGWRDEDDASRVADGKPGATGGRSHRLRFGRAPLGFCGGVLLATLCAISQQVSIDLNRGFIADQQRRMNAELRRAMDQARQEYLRAHPPGPDLSAADMEKDVKKAEDAARDNIVKSHYLYIPKGNSLRYLTLGNPSLASDYLWLTSLQYVSSPFQQGHKFDMLHRFYEEMLDLDPHWIDVYVNAGKILSALDPNRGDTELFLCRCMTRNPGDFRLPMEAGRLYVVPTVRLQQSREYSRKASEFFEEALSRRDLPKLDRATLEDLIARLKREAGLHGAAAEKLWKIINDAEVPKTLRESSSREWLQAESLVRADAFQQLVNAFKARHGAWPANLREALRDYLSQPDARAPEWLKSSANGGTPLDAYGHELQYDPSKGEVSSRGVRALQALRASRMIDTLIDSIYSAPGKSFPQDLAELTRYVRAFFNTPQGPPYTVVEALGEDIDATRNPLGEPWNYDPQTGKITLPPYCSPRELFRNADMTLEGRVPAYFK